MIDHIKSIDLVLPIEPLLANDRLRFPLPVDERTGEVIEQPRWAFERGLFFTLTPSRVEQRLRCELKGSLHRYYNKGLHNADAFTIAALLATLDELVMTYHVDPFASRLNNLEFGLNLALPFPVAQVLGNLISYKNRDFTRESGEGFTYYQCHTQRYVLKLYDKGAQYRTTVAGLPENLLRVEIKVLKMAYLTQQGIALDTLADLLDVNQYPKLGALLVKVFSDILFDEPTVELEALGQKDQALYQNGRNPRFWGQRRQELETLREDLGRGPERRLYNAHRERLRSDEERFRRLLSQHRRGPDWASQCARLLTQCWERLTQVNPALAESLIDRQTAWRNALLPTSDNLRQDQKSGKLTGVSSDENVKKPGKLTESEMEKSGKLTRYIPEKSGKLTGVSGQIAERGTDITVAEKSGQLTGSGNAEIWQINPLSIELICQDVLPVPDASSMGRGTPLILSETHTPAESVSNHVISPAAARPTTESPARQEGTREPPAKSPSKTVTNSPKPGPRVCPVTNLDITHQRPNAYLATKTTFSALFEEDRDRFDALVDQLLTPEQAAESMSARCYWLTEAVRKQWAKSKSPAGSRARKTPAYQQQVVRQPEADLDEAGFGAFLFAQMYAS